jgi:peptide deformylase
VSAVDDGEAGPVLVMGVRQDDFPRYAPEGLRGSPRRVTVVGEDVLHRPCAPVEHFGTPELAALIDDMFASMYAADGVGLAANQIGIGLRLFVYDCPDGADGADGRHVGHLVNPVLEAAPAAGPPQEDGEGCLSVPGPVRDLGRPTWARASGFDQHGRPVTIEGGGYFARCLAHETDHLDGRLYIDLLDEAERAAVLAEMATMVDEVMAQRAARAAELASLAGRV